jgi:hypothetical protein
LNDVPDISHQWGGDLETGPDGDLRIPPDPVVTQQRILRRLLTASGAYVWNPGYGAGLGSLVGHPVDSRRIQALIGAQLLNEAAVTQDPAPAVTVRNDASQTGQSLYVEISYRDAESGQDQHIAVPVRT